MRSWHRTDKLSSNIAWGTDSVTGLLNRVKASGISIGDLRTEEADLEDVFMALTYASDKK